MQDQYEKFIQIQIFHSYYQDGKAKGISVEPDANTAGVMKKYGLILRNIGNGIEIYKKKQQESNLLQYLHDELDIETLDFDMIMQDYTFYNFTESPLNQIGIFEYSNLSLKDGNEGSLVMKPKFTEVSSTDNFGTLTLNLKELIVQISNGPAEFEIQFHARSTQWNYYIIANETTTGLEIVSKEATSFVGPDEAALPNGSRAQKFSSGSQLLTMQELPNRKFDLVQVENITDNSIAPNVIISGLPNASPNQLGITEIEGRQVATSDMYVYI